MREGPRDTGGCVLCYIDQLLHPDSTVFRPGGIHNDDVLIAGQISTLGDTEAAVALQRLMVRTVTLGVHRVRTLWLGPEALAMFEAGARWTVDVQ